MTKLRILAFAAFVTLFLVGLGLLSRGTPSSPETAGLEKEKPKEPGQRIAQEMDARKLVAHKVRPQSPRALSRSAIFSTEESRRARKKMIHGSDAERLVSAATLISSQLRLGQALVAECAKAGAATPRFEAELKAKNAALRERVLKTLPHLAEGERQRDPDAQAAAQHVLKKLVVATRPVADACKKLEEEPEKGTAELLPPNLLPRAHRILMTGK